MKTNIREDKLVTYCNDLEKFIEKVREARNLNSSWMKLKLCLDGGGDFFKVALAVCDRKNHEEKS